MTTIAVKPRRIAWWFYRTLTTTGLPVLQELKRMIATISGDNTRMALLLDRSPYTAYVGYAPDNGNGGCNVLETGQLWQYINKNYFKN